MKKTFAIGLTVGLAMCLVAINGMFTSVNAQDPLPYAAIKIPLPDTLDQLYRDSATIQIGRVRVNQAGYRPDDNKWFYYVAPSGSSGGTFSVIDFETGNQVSTGTLVSKSTDVSSQLKIRASTNAACPGCEAGDERYTMQSAVVTGALYEGNMGTGLSVGRYRVRVGSDTSAPFWVHDEVYSWVRDAAIKFPGINRCGNSDSWFHGSCHLQDKTLGGWHDCGDHLKEAITQSYLHAMLALGSAALRDHDVDHYGRNHNNTRFTDGVPDVLYEAKHGSDYIIRSYENANGIIPNMITSFGERGGGDHQWWGQPEFQDMMPPSRGGPPRPAYSHLGANVLGRFAAGLALPAKNYETFDRAYAEKSIKIAKELYEYAKANQDDVTETAAYSGNGESQDKLAFGALGLLYATKDRKYLNDLIYDKTIYNEGASDAFPNFGFDGGWFAKQPQFSKGSAVTDWGSQHTIVLWGFFRLILADEQMCKDLGISEEERMVLIGRVAGQMLFSLSGMGIGSNGDASMELPSIGHWDSYSPVVMRYDDKWKHMQIVNLWMWNRYQFGHIFDVFAYSDLAMWLEDNDIQLPNRNATNWRGRDMRELMIRQVDYMLGVNQWDVSMIFGIGAKNHNHPHHRAANPEGRNVPGAFYQYRPPVGGLAAGTWPANEHYDRVEAWKDHELTETGIDASATMIIPLMALSKPDPRAEPPTATVRTVYVGYDEAIIEVRQTRFGMSTIRYAEDGTEPNLTVSADSNGMIHRITLTGLQGATRYNFEAIISDMYSHTATIRDRDGEYFTFVTLKEKPGDAQISNVKVCKITSDSAEIFWYTPNGNYDSKVVYGTTKPVTEGNGMVQDQNIYGRPTQFHYVKIGGLKEKTTYYFYVENNGTRDDNGGEFYTFTTPVEQVAFDVRFLKYDDDFFGLNIVNQDIKAYDSLELRIYVRMPDTISTGLTDTPETPSASRRAFADHVGLRVDIGIKYRSDGYQDVHFKQEVDDFVQRARPVRIDDTYNPVDNTWAFYIPVPMGAAEMQSGARFRLDLMFDTRSHFAPYEDLMNVRPPMDVLNRIWEGWSFSAHSRDNGEPVDYPGIPSGNKDDIDAIYHITPINNYVTIYRKNEFVWGYSPSASEMQDKKTNYDMISQVTSPLHNPSEEYLFMEQVMNMITVSGWAKVMDENGNPMGSINDIWVNGNRVSNVSSVAQYDRAADQWNFTIPVPVKNGGNNVDITLFGGPDESCAECYGCAFSNHSFYLEFRGAEPFPSTMRLESCADPDVLVRDSAVIDETCFYVVVRDDNGNINKEQRDTLYVTVVNPVLGDSIRVALVETGNETGTFRSTNSVSVLPYDAPVSNTNIRMDGGQTIRITYIDPTDPDDVSRAVLASRADFPVPVDAWFADTSGKGEINRVTIRYTSELLERPDSLQLTIPGVSGAQTYMPPRNVIRIDDADNSIVHLTVAPAIERTTGFRASEVMTVRSFLRHGANPATRVAVADVRDAAGPALLDRALLMERETGSLDTVEIILSEPMTGASMAGATLMLKRIGADDRALEVLSAIDSSTFTNSLTLLIDPAGNAIREGDSLYINSASSAADRAGNKAHEKNVRVPVQLKSLAPRITQGFYSDVNADGVIDRVTINFSKPMQNTGLKLWLSRDGGDAMEVDWFNMFGAPDTISSLSVDLSKTGIFADTVLTVTDIRATVTHNGFPGVTMNHVLTDRAAPVIYSAQYRPGAEGEKDTLAVTFSEVLTAAPSKPFKLLYVADGTVYKMQLRNMNQTSIARSHRFIVDGIESNTVRYPGSGDSIWINTEDNTNISDTSTNVQLNENNRKVRMTFKPAPITVKIIPMPNPFTPGANPFGGPARIVVRPETKSVGEIDLKGTITILDKMGKVVLTDNLKLEKYREGGDQEKHDLYYDWNGMNKNGRRAGTGTYMVRVAVEHVQQPDDERVPPVKSQGLIYLLWKK